MKWEVSRAFDATRKSIGVALTLELLIPDFS